jgi:cytochrome c6
MSAIASGCSTTAKIEEGLSMSNSFVRIVLAVGVSCIASPAHAQSGADTYKAKCQMCHAADGSGSTPAGKAMKALPLNSPDLIKASDADLIAATTNGKGKMPAYKTKLTAAQIQETVTYIRTLQK